MGYKYSHPILLVVCFLLATAICEENHGTESSEHDDHFELNSFDFFGEGNTEDDEHLEHHLKEDVGIEKSVENMTDFEKDWYYFKLHDTNEDFSLDGLELLKAWQHHYLEHMGHSGMDHTDDMDTEKKEKFVQSQNEMFIGNRNFVELVDNILKEVDLNSDGYVNYMEYMLAKEKQRSEEEKAKAEANKKEPKTKLP